jgi:hypothetical protein
MKRVYIAATEQHAGKTTISVGLYRAAMGAGLRACFIKPVGQRYVEEEDARVDEDAVLFKRALLAEGEYQHLSPVTIPRGFTREYIFNREPERIHGPILEAMESLEADHDVAIIEGTGHAGVGSVIDASNARVARLLEAPCVVVTGGGIGRCIDQLCLNKALFEKWDVPVVGAVINKVYEEKYEKVSRAVRQGLANQDMRCLGVMPYRREMAFPTMIQLQEEYGLEVLCGGAYLSNKVRDIIVGAMSPQNMVTYLTEGSLVVVPGDRVDNILASINAHLMTERGSAPQIAGLLLTGGFVPPLSIINMLCEVDVPVLLIEEDTAAAAFKVRSLIPKITVRDTEKIAIAERMVRDYVDTDHILKAIGLPLGADSPAQASE